MHWMNLMKLKKSLYLREIEGFSYKEISNIMEINEGTVKSKLHYVKNKIKRTAWKICKVRERIFVLDELKEANSYIYEKLNKLKKDELIVAIERCYRK